MDVEKIVLEDKSMQDFLLKLSKEEFENNILELYKHHLYNKNCENCKGKRACVNDPQYMESYLEKHGTDVYQKFRACKYKQDNLEVLFMSDDVSGELDRTEERARVFKYMKQIVSNINEGKGKQGIYLHGKFGTGKSYLMMKVAKEIAKDRKVLYVYYPELINNLKNALINNNNFDYLMNRIKKVDVLVLDDVGREQVTEFNRDQILSPLIQYRYINNLPTFITSNCGIDELRERLAYTKDKIESINSDAIIDRIVHMMEVVQLEGKDYR